MPIEARPWLLWVQVQLLAAKPDGLATGEESRRLQEIGESLDSLVSATCGAQLVGRITGNARREFYFYAAEPGELPRRRVQQAHLVAGTRGAPADQGAAEERQPVVAARVPR